MLRRVLNPHTISSRRRGPKALPHKMVHDRDSSSSCRDKVARMPVRNSVADREMHARAGFEGFLNTPSSKGRNAEHWDHRHLNSNATSGSNSKDAQQIPTNSRLRRTNQKYSLSANSPLICTSSRKLKSSSVVDDCGGTFLTPPSLSRNNSMKLKKKHNEILVCPSLSRKSSRKLIRSRSKSRDRGNNNSNNKNREYRSEADFLIRNQHQFTQKDFHAVLRALAEESRLDEQRRMQEEESMLLAQELESEDTLMRHEEESSSLRLAQKLDSEAELHRRQERESLRLAQKLADEDDERNQQQERESIRLAHELASKDADAPASATPRQSATQPAEDLEALVVALRAELDESNTKRRDEEQSFRLACQLVSDEVRESSGLLQSDRGCSSGCCRSRDHHEAEEGSFDVQCQACHLDIEKEEMLRELPCGHKFHAFCINRWFLMNKKDCPYCRKPAGWGSLHVG